MKKLALGALFAGLAACGGGNNSSVTIVDGPSGDSGPGACNPLAQTGCNTGEKCTWIVDQEDPPLGHIGCTMDGATALGAACTEPPVGTGDSCVKGTVCLSGECKLICDVNGGAPMCDDNHSCTRYADFFEAGGTAVAGVCDPACDPNTQELKVGTNKVACGSPMPAMPSKGCYGFDEFSCAPAISTATDRMPPRTNSAGNPYLNGCAPGYLPFFFEMTGSTTTWCSGYCAAMETHNAATAPTPAERALGNAAALGKAPGDTMAVPGGAICTPTERGSAPSSRCKFIWPYLLEESTGELPPLFDQGPNRDTLGVCMDISKFSYDPEPMGGPMVQYPDCASLSLTTADPMHGLATEWGCMTIGNTPATFTGRKALNPAMQNVRLPKQAEMELVRHSFN